MNRIRTDITIEELLDKYNITYKKTTPEEAEKANSVIDEYVLRPENSFFSEGKSDC